MVFTIMTLKEINKTNSRKYKKMLRKKLPKDVQKIKQIFRQSMHMYLDTQILHILYLKNTLGT